MKVDLWGHDFDHTFPGAQPVLWDVAGAIIQWRMRSNEATKFLGALRETGMSFEPHCLRFFLLAYVAFRIGMCSLADEPTGVLHYKGKADRLSRLALW